MNSDANADLTYTVLRLVFMGALIVGSLWVMSPFLLPLAWASTIVVAAWPVFQRLVTGFGGRRGAAVTVMTLAMLLILFVPVYLVTSTLVAAAQRWGELSELAAAVAVPEPPPWLGGLPLVGPRLGEYWRQVATGEAEDLGARLLPLARTVVGWLAGKVGDIGLVLFEFLLTVVFAAVLFANGETAVRGVSRFARRLGGSRGDAVIQLAAQAVRAVALGVVVTAVVQAALGGIGLAVAGVPFTPLLAALMLVLGIAQVGPLPVLVPAVIWVYSTSGTLWGTLFLVWSAVVGLMDNVLRPILIRRGADLPLILLLAGVIGGLFAFGVIGLFVGPVVLAVAYTLLVAWVNDALGPDAASNGIESGGGEHG